MSTLALIAAKAAAVVAGLGAGLAPAAGGSTLDGFAVGMLVSGGVFLLVTAPRQATRKNTPRNGVRSWIAAALPSRVLGQYPGLALEAKLVGSADADADDFLLAPVMLPTGVEPVTAAGLAAEPRLTSPGSAPDPRLAPAPAPSLAPIPALATAPNLAPIPAPAPSLVAEPRLAPEAGHAAEHRPAGKRHRLVPLLRRSAEAGPTIEAGPTTEAGETTESHAAAASQASAPTPAAELPPVAQPDESAQPAEPDQSRRPSGYRSKHRLTGTDEHHAWPENRRTGPRHAAPSSARRNRFAALGQPRLVQAKGVQPNALAVRD